MTPDTTDTVEAGGHRTLEMFGIALFAAISIALADWLILRSLQFSPGFAAALVVSALLAGWLLSDFASGFVHWLGDTFGTIDMPVLGEAFIRPFREHHTDPKGITRHDFIETNGNNCIVVCVCLYLPMSLLFLVPDNAIRFWLVTAGVTLGFATFMTNQIHRWAHLDDPPWYARLFQRLGLFMTAEHHDVHHAAPYDTYYCITSGWLNPILQRTRFFDYAERVVRSVYGFLTGAESADRR